MHPSKDPLAVGLGFSLQGLGLRSLNLQKTILNYIMRIYWKTTVNEKVFEFVLLDTVN